MFCANYCLLLYLQHCTIKESNFVGLMTLNVTVTLVLTTMFLSISTRPGIVMGYLNYLQYSLFYIVIVIDSLEIPSLSLHQAPPHCLHQDD